MSDWILCVKLCFVELSNKPYLLQTVNTMCVFAMTPDTDECLHCQCMYQCHVSDTVTRMTKVDIIKLVFGKYSAISLNRMAIRNIAQAVLQAFLFKQEFLFFCFPNLAILFIFSLFLGNLAMFLLFFKLSLATQQIKVCHVTEIPVIQLSYVVETCN